MDGITRRRFLQLVGGTGVLGLAPRALYAQPSGAQTLGDPVSRSAERAPDATLFHYLNEREVAFLRAAVDHLIPADEQWPGAAEAGVVEYIDLQLAGAYGHGHRIYLQGPWALGTTQQGYQLRLTPRELYSLGIEAVNALVAREGVQDGFAGLDAAAQVRVLEGLEQGEVELDSLPAPVFFETLLANTVEGYFADPAYGGNKDMAGWRMIGFPGAYAAYVVDVERHGVPFTRRPMSMIDTVHTPGH